MCLGVAGCPLGEGRLRVGWRGAPGVRGLGSRRVAGRAGVIVPGRAGVAVRTALLVSMGCAAHAAAGVPLMRLPAPSTTQSHYSVQANTAAAVLSPAKDCSAQTALHLHSTAALPYRVQPGASSSRPFRVIVY